LRLPFEHRQAKSAFGDEGVTGQWFKRFGQAVGLDLVVTRNDPDLAPVFHPDLRGTGHMARRVKRHAHTVHVAHRTKGDGFQRDVSQPVADHRGGGVG